MLSDADFAIVARELKARSGALLSRETNAQAEARLTPLSRREGFSAVSEMLMTARTRQDGKLWGLIADALAQTETRFFRDKTTFAQLKALLPELKKQRGDARLRIWSAGCGTGQEAYSIAMMLEAMRVEGFAGADITATDLSDRQLDKARSGLYTQFEVQRGLPIRSLIAHFEKVADLWRINDRLRAAVRFETHNLLTHPGQLGAFDVVLCANVLSAFDPPTREATLERIADVMQPGGVLLLGAGETLPDGAYGLAQAGTLIVRAPSARRAA